MHRAQAAQAGLAACHQRAKLTLDTAQLIGAHMVIGDRISRPGHKNTESPRSVSQALQRRASRTRRGRRQWNQQRAGIRRRSRDGRQRVRNLCREAQRYEQLLIVNAPLVALRPRQLLAKRVWAFAHVGGQRIPIGVAARKQQRGNTAVHRQTFKKQG